MGAAGIRDLMRRMEGVVDQAEADKQGIAADWRSSAEYKQQRMAEVEQRTGDLFVSVLRGLWGDEQDHTKVLQGGAGWTSLEAEAQRLYHAKTNADKLDPLRVANERGRVVSIMGQFRNLAELGAWYDGAGAYERRGLQDQPDVVRKRFGAEARIGSFLRRLENDRAESLRTPEVAKAEAALEQTEQAFGEAYEQSKRLAERLGMSGLRSRAYRILGRMRVAKSYEDASRLDSKCKWHLEKLPPVVLIKSRP
jgi:hypothetical protein